MTRILISCLLLIASLNVLAQQQRTLTDVITVDQQQQLSIKVSVGDFTLTTSDDNQIHLSVTVKNKNEHWFSSSNLDDVKLSKNITDQQIYLRVNGDDIRETWQISVPKNLAIRLHMGVGDAKLHGISQDVDVELGVGDGHIQLSDENFQRIDAHSGVGDATIKGFANVNNVSHLVGHNSHWRGNGQHQANIEVGVGEATVSR